MKQFYAVNNSNGRAYMFQSKGDRTAWVREDTTHRAPLSSDKWRNRTKAWRGESAGVRAGFVGRSIK